MWQIWMNTGLGESIPVKGGSRFKHSFNLDEFGIEVPPIQSSTETTTDKKEQITEIKSDDSSIQQKII
jgi:hypothetical protein